ncbi:hypothetical protein J3R30DRAFT_1793445 [Lentinula aciculospora]|uniref:F-box domain-containing protein n=1 Tax=Lentinula aciculospora TaxID=153920 RepID=A0A9W9DST2_9AGAR|nr:hypothetical protein J3R30DRAFT_1793445 [Lentinula aciculospora]
MLLQDLPNDILLDTLIYLEPTDIFSLRKTCRRLQAFTSEREVWTNIYTNCLFFLPPGPLFTQSVPNLERIILRVYRLHAIWVNSSNLGKPSSVFLTFRHILSSKIRDAAFLRIYRSRYLVIGGAYGFLIYDLQANCEIFRHKGKPDERLFWLHSFGFRMVDHDNKDSFILFGKMRKGAQTSSLAMCKLNPLGHAFIVDTANMPTFISVGSEFCVLRNGSGHSLLHISTQKAYPFASTAVPSLNTRAIFLPGHVLLSYTLDPTRSRYISAPYTLLFIRASHPRAYLDFL